MADKKISELTNLSSGSLNSADDEFPIVDSSSGQTKKITPDALFDAVGDVRYPQTELSTRLSDMNDTQNVNGFIYADASSVNKPLSVANFLGIQSKRTDEVSWQFGAERNAGSTPNELWSRVETSDGVFTDWQKVLREVDGDARYIPERGSNANGEYVRFPDGTQICTVGALTGASPNLSHGGIYRSALVTWTFPASFVANPVVAGQVQQDSDWLGSQSPSNTSVSMRVLSGTTDATVRDLRVCAIGRWK